MIAEGVGKAAGTSTAKAAGSRITLEQIDAGLKPVAKKSDKDSKDKQEEEALRLARYSVETANLAEANLDLKANRTMRLDYANKVFAYLVAYSIFAGLVLACSGWKFLGFVLPEIALTALVGSTAVSAIGLVGIVVTGLFRAPPVSKAATRAGS
jgi:hypothetical protein